MKRLALLLALFASPGAAQRDPLDALAFNLSSPHRPREVYRALLGGLGTSGLRPRALLLDRYILTFPGAAGDSSYAILVAVELEPSADSTRVVVEGGILRPQGKDCSGAECDRQRAAMLTSMAAFSMRLDSIKPHRATRADSLEGAGVLGYSPDNPIRTGGIENPDDSPARQHAYLSSLRGPAGQLVRHLRLGSCCEYPSVNGPDGKGMLDAYEITYDGLDQPVVLYLTLYDSGETPPPQGFTRQAVPETRSASRP
jgi:hypothetical protein